MRRNSPCRTHVTVSWLRQVTQPSPSRQADGVALLRIPDGFEGAPLGFWCPVCGAEVAEAQVSLALVEDHRSGRDGARWLMPVHRSCCTWAPLD